jgi:hypothetical protein
MHTMKFFGTCLILVSGCSVDAKLVSGIECGEGTVLIDGICEADTGTGPPDTADPPIRRSRISMAMAIPPRMVTATMRMNSSIRVLWNSAMTSTTTAME